MSHPWFNFAPKKRYNNNENNQIQNITITGRSCPPLRYKAGMKQRSDNVFFIDFSPLTEEEREEIRRKDDLSQRPDDTQEELFGGWI